MASKLLRKELPITDYCPSAENHKCIKWADYELIRHKLEEADKLYHNNWVEIQHLRDYINRLQAVLTEHGIEFAVSRYSFYLSMII